MNEMQQAEQAFFEEARDMLRQIEESLLRLENDAQDVETLNSLFRAAHTIKGSAGLFGFDRIVAFTHHVETLLEHLRTGAIGFEADLAAALLSCADHMGQLVEETAAQIVDPGTEAAGGALLGRLESWLPASAKVAEPQPGSSSGHELIQARLWHLTVAFGADTFRNGMDPLAFIGYLSALGDVCHVACDAPEMPEAEDFDPETCYLRWEVSLQYAGTKEALAGVFEFIRDDCEMHITAPDAAVGEWVEILGRMKGEAQRIGDMLVGCGAVTRHELAAAVAAQSGMGREAPPLGEVLVAQKAANPEIVQAALTRQREQRGEESRFIRVAADKLDALINLVGELVIAGAGANLLASRLKEPRMLEATRSVTDLVEEIRNGALQLRMVQIGETFSRFRRVVHDVSRDLGRQVHLEIEGADTELDKSVVERIADPLMHLVRNALDHGIEGPEERRAAEKPEQALLLLRAFHDSGSIIIEVSDDGRGLDRARILEKARERGLIAPGVELPDEDVLNLIFQPGFSTAQKVTNLSGRGVGMDVVRKNIEALRGTVAIASTEGQGTTIVIRLPLTLAIIDGFLIGVGNSSYVVPLDMVVECLQLPGDIAPACNFLDLRGEVLPFIRLRQLFDIDAPPPLHENVVVVRSGAARAGLVVDALMGEFQTVIKPLGQIFRNLHGIGGSTILGNGEVALILDVAALITLAMNADAKRAPSQEVVRAPGTLRTARA